MNHYYMEYSIGQQDLTYGITRRAIMKMHPLLWELDYNNCEDDYNKKMRLYAFKEISEDVYNALRLNGFEEVLDD